MRQDPKDTTEKDDIDRLFARLERDEPPPGSAFKTALEELRQKQAKPVVRRNWARVAQLGLAIAAVLALAIVAVSALILSNNNNSGSLAANTTTVAAITAETTSVTATTTATQVLTTAPVTTTTATQTPVTTERTEVVNAQTPDPTQPETTASATTTSQPTTAKETSSAPQTAKTPKPLDTPITNTVPTTTRPTFLSVGGKVAAYDKGAGIITLNATNGKSVIVKLSSSTVVSKKSTPATTADITVGATLTAEGSYNAQNQLEATAIILDIQSSSQPIGDPGFPDEKS